jgi:hypothetical protein
MQTPETVVSPRTIFDVEVPDDVGTIEREPAVGSLAPGETADNADCVSRIKLLLQPVQEIEIGVGLFDQIARGDTHRSDRATSGRNRVVNLVLGPNFGEISVSRVGQQPREE